MNGPWLASSRISCFRPRAVARTWHVFDNSPASKLARRPLHSFSTCAPRLGRDLGWISHQFPGISRNAPCRTPLQTTIRTLATQRVILSFDQLPPDYKDEDGLAFRATPLSKNEVVTIFGKGVDPNAANKTLRILHGRRVAGSLSDPELSHPRAPEELRFEKIALSWLRKNAPVNEKESAQRLAERQIERLEAELREADEPGPYRPNSRDIAARDGSVYGTSGLDAIREANERKLDEAEERRARTDQTQDVQYNTGTPDVMRSRAELRRAEENPKFRYYLERSKILPDVPPEMSTWRRLWPSALVVLFTIGASITFAQIYIPPARSARLWPDIPPAAATIIPLIAANTLVFIAWRVPPAWRMLNKYFVLVPGYPFALSTLGNVFSHTQAYHYFVNMAVLWFVGTRLHDQIGRADFLAIYISAGLFGSFASLALRVIQRSFATSSLGASGAIWGIVTAYLWLNSEQSFKFLGLPPDPYPGVPAFVLLAILGGLEVASVLGKGVRFRGSEVDHYAHLGGFVTGLGAAQMLKIRREQRQKMERERRKHMTVLDKLKERPWSK
ncbi:hypothetical protein F5884DRAFT_857906 [Xylogone sp. PMI_703]|nr:hypothetical protein F5884DRAFT_857906 [Xylogone sp. PMI_703]